MPRVDALLNNGARLLAASSAEPRRDAQLLLLQLLRKDRAWLLSHPEFEVGVEQHSEYEAMLQRRALHEPMQYILGEQEFYGLRFAVRPGVLIPRPETEHLVEAVLRWSAAFSLGSERGPRIVDVGTGSGAIAVALACLLPQARLYAVDLSQSALQIAKENAEAHNVQDRICFVQSDLLAALRGEQVDCVVSNPPYVQSGEELSLEVAEWEPSLALFAGPDGMDVYRRLIPHACKHLHPGGLLALEIGAGQQDAIAQLMQHQGGWDAPHFEQDLRGIARVALTCKSKKGMRASGELARRDIKRVAR